MVTELRGDQDPDDDHGQWVELYNASGAELDLLGLHVRLRSLSGSTDDTIIIRRSLVVPADGYTVIGLGPDETRPADIDYAAGSDAGTALSPTGAVDFKACDDVEDDQFADSLRYDAGLPSIGTYSLGLAPPTATGNDVTTNWCTNPSPYGTPGGPNPPCP